MSLKRVAERQLTADNWDDEDEQPDPDDVTGRFKPAEPHVLANRKIRTALRRKQNAPQQDQEKKGIFSGFSGFGKTSSNAPTPSFNFVSNLVNKNLDNNKSESFNFLKNSSSTTITEKCAEKIDLNTEKDKTSLIKTNSITNTTSENSLLNKNDEYYVNLKSLNISVSEWIKSHVDKNPYCILTPIFDDYINHLKELEKLKHIPKTNETNSSTIETKLSSLSENKNNLENHNKIQIDKNTEDVNKNNLDTSKNSFSSLLNKSTPSSPTIFSMSPYPKASTAVSPTSTISTGFSTNPNSKSPMFSFGKTEITTSTPFSFGTGKPFTFGNLTSKETPPPPKTEEENEDDEPPKVAFTPVVEEDNVYSKKCKVFVKKDDTFGDRGVGMLYLKPIKDSEKYQLIVRADTSLGNLLLNLVLSDIPMQRMGKNNVMLVCIPTGDSTTPVPTLLRVKTAEEADELLETLNKYKK